MSDAAKTLLHHVKGWRSGGCADEPTRGYAFHAARAWAQAIIAGTE
ncbi:hypothetical protein ACIUZ0_08635 [Pseudomonas aeruginosa]|jgi:hypothetical protein|uniref:Uncharacterized protein n=2 Tax=Pseudomonas aeruginosa group TaxID=136841 RepID=A0A2L1KFV7_PSEAI|nr:MULTISPECIES: hypothetical protein [Pseudomonas]AVK09414.1 hypothetical protein CSB93_6709 [Pseudomonas paraeruginosa]AVE21209.1 Hypothetical protein [Pseudomonas aeruginosa]AWE95641.1 hypothetical protein CSC28_6730 [Pseudomonas paraeruginosa]EKU5056524.1 hypothetical protein [Pseudomonas aeruginosa]EKU8275360.1 hypothetical protein [Pseudomonas aeruginosa]